MKKILSFKNTYILLSSIYIFTNTLYYLNRTNYTEFENLFIKQTKPQQFKYNDGKKRLYYTHQKTTILFECHDGLQEICISWHSINKIQNMNVILDKNCRSEKESVIFCSGFLSSFDSNKNNIAFYFSQSDKNIDKWKSIKSNIFYTQTTLSYLVIIFLVILFHSMYGKLNKK